MDEYNTAPSTVCRVKYSEEQRDLLEAIFEQSKTIRKEKAAEIALLLNVTPKQIQTWFQNKRAKIRRDCMRMSRQSYVLKRPSLPILDAICNKTSDSSKPSGQTPATSTFEFSSTHPEYFSAPSHSCGNASTVQGVFKQNICTHHVPHITIESYDEGTQNSSNLQAGDSYSCCLHNSAPTNYERKGLTQWPFQPVRKRDTLSIPTLSNDRPGSCCSSPMSTISESTWNSPGKTSPSSDTGFFEELMTSDMMQRSPSTLETEYKNMVPTNRFIGTATACSKQNRNVTSTINSSCKDTSFPLTDVPLHQAMNITMDELNWSLTDINQNMTPTNINQNMSFSTRYTPVDNNLENFSPFQLRPNTNDVMKENYAPWCAAQYHFTKTNSMAPADNISCENFVNQVQNNCHLGVGSFHPGYIGPVENQAHM